MALALAVAVQTPLTPTAQAASKLSVKQRIDALEKSDTTRDPKAALADYSALVTDAEAAKNIAPEDLSRAYLAMGSALYYSGEMEKALAAVEKAGRLLTSAGKSESTDMATVQQVAGATLTSMARYDDALAVTQKALELRRLLFGPDSTEYASTLFTIGRIHFRRGKIDEAVAAMGQAVALDAKANKPGSVQRLVHWSSYAVILDNVGRYEEALAQNRAATEWGERNLPADHPMIGATLNNFGSSLNHSGRFSEAEPVLRRALEARIRVLGKEHADIAITMNNLASALAKLGRVEEAEVMILAARDIYVAANYKAKPTAPGVLLLGAANLAASRGDSETALARRREALDMLEKAAATDHPDVARARAELADSLQGAGRLGEATALIDLAVPVYRATLSPDHYLRAEGETVQGLIRFRNGDRKGGYALARAAVGAIETRLLDSAVSPREAVDLGQRYKPIFSRFVALALEAGEQEDAFRGLQLANLSEVAATYGALAARAAAENQEAGALSRRLQDEAQAALLLRQRYAAAVGRSAQAEAEKLQAEVTASDARIGEMQVALDRVFPGFRALSRPTPVTLAAFTARLPKASALLAPIRIEGAMLAIAVTPAGLSWEKVAVAPPAMAEAIRSVRASVETVQASPSFDRKAAWTLYKILFPPKIAAATARASHLALFGGESLATVPLGLLITAAPRGRDDDPAALRRSAWLIRDKAISISLTLAPVVTPPARRTTSFAGFGGPALALPEARMQLASLYRGGSVDVKAIRELPSLPGAAGELREIGRALGDERTIVVGDAATESAVKAADLSNVSVLAFATHGLVSGEMAGLGEPALVFTPPAAPLPADDGLLTASEISTLRLDADWVILSACNTASGSGGAAPAYSGLGRAFIHAGARALLLSHWNVRDDVAARLTVDTVRNAAAGAGRAQALRKAMLAVIDDRKVAAGSHPSIWAPLVLIGD